MPKKIITTLEDLKGSIDEITERHLAEQLEGLELIDFLPNILKDCRADCGVLNHWREYFKKNKVPFVIVAGEKHFVLWKEDFSLINKDFVKTATEEEKRTVL